MFTKAHASAVLKFANGEKLTRREKKLLAEAREHRQTPDETEAARRSFGFGNAVLANPDITREAVDRAADDLARERARKIVPFGKR